MFSFPLPKYLENVLWQELNKSVVSECLDETGVVIPLWSWKDEDSDTQ